MGLIENLIRKWTNAPKRAVAFVDYEHWYYSYQNLFGIKPKIADWRRELEASYQLLDIMVFGDFSSPGINQELNRIREVTNTIIETQNSSQISKKDMTDFIMLDYLYQLSAERKDIDTYILFTGDGHFQSVVKFITQKKEKEVVVYGVRDAFSQRLKNVATKWVEYPCSEELNRSYYGMILKNFDYIASRTNIFPTFLKTVDVVAKYNHVDPEPVRASLQEMINKGYIRQEVLNIGFHKKAKVLVPEWELLVKDGYWST